MSKWQELTQLWQRRSSQRWQPRNLLMLLIIGSTTLAVSATAIVSYEVLLRLILDNLKQNALLRVQERVDEIDNWLAIRKAEIKTIANTPTFRTMDWSVVSSYLKSEQKRLKDFYFFAMINPDGSQYNTGVAGASQNVKDRKYFQQAIAGQVYVSDPVISRSLGTTTVPISAPVWSSPPARDEPIGVIGAAIRIERVAEVVGSLNYGFGSYAFALNSEGMPIVHPDARVMGTWEKPAPSFLQAKDPNLQRLATKMVRKLQGIELMQIDGAWVYVAYLPLQEADWSMALVIPHQNIECHLRALNLLATVVGVLLAIATSAAMRRVRLSELSRARAAREALLNRLMHRIRDSLELDRILQTTVEEVGNLLQVEQAAFGWYDAQQRSFEIQRISSHERLCLQVGRFAVEPDFEARLQQGEQVQLKPAKPNAKPGQLELKAQSYLALPIQTENASMGYLIVVRDSRWFCRQGEKELLQAVADQLAIAITQSHLYLQTREQAQQLALALDESEVRFRLAVDNIPNTFVVYNPQRQLQFVNAQGLRLSGKPLEELLGHTDEEIWSSEVTAQYLPILLRTVETRTIQTGECDSTLPGFGSFTFIVTYVPLLDERGEIYQILGITHDITERKRAEFAFVQLNQELEHRVQERTAELQQINAQLQAEIRERKQAEQKLEQLTAELQRSNRDLEQFASVVSHDLQEPLRAVTGFTQLLMQEYRNQLDESAQEYMTFIMDGATRMRQLIEDLLAYSRLSSHTQKLAPTDCNAVLSEAIANLQVAIAQSHATITHDPLPTLSADKIQLVQLFQNLIGNAVKFRRDEPPQVHISVQLSDREWLLCVRDNGIGIQPRHLGKIFEVFKRLHSRREFSGTGIGLAICKKIVERHGGRIWAEAQPGVGSAFYFTIPLTPHLPLNLETNDEQQGVSTN